MTLFGTSVFNDIPNRVEYFSVSSSKRPNEPEMVTWARNIRTAYGDFALRGYDGFAKALVELSGVGFPEWRQKLCQRVYPASWMRWLAI
jgi:hypothetical protein